MSYLESMEGERSTEPFECVRLERGQAVLTEQFRRCLYLLGARRGNANGAILRTATFEEPNETLVYALYVNGSEAIRIDAGSRKFSKVVVVKSQAGELASSHQVRNAADHRKPSSLVGGYWILEWPSTKVVLDGLSS